jgi:hypothetical protein
MTDDDLDRALFALPLEEPPADLHRQIMTAVMRPAPAFRQWELWVIGAVLGLIGWLTFALFVASPESGERLIEAAVGASRQLGLFSLATYVWLAIGASSVWWISSLTFMPVRRLTVYNR